MTGVRGLLRRVLGREGDSRSVPDGGVVVEDGVDAAGPTDGDEDREAVRGERCTVVRGFCLSQSHLAHPECLWQFFVSGNKYQSQQFVNSSS